MADAGGATGGRGPKTRTPAAAMLLGAGVTVVATLPAHLTGALAVQLTEELAFGLAAFGIAVALFRAASAANSFYLGRLADRLGATRSIRLAALIAAVACLGIAVASFNWLSLVAWLVVASAANSLGQPAANRLLVNNVDRNRLGVAFGLKQSAPPTAGLLAGLSVPLIALTLGWRWAYALTGLLALVVAVAARTAAAAGAVSPARRPTGDPPPLGDTRRLLPLAVAFGLGTATSSSVVAFYVEGAVAAGTSPATAGYLLAAGSMAAVVTRLICGVVCDRLPRGHLRLCGALLAGGSVGLVLLALARPATMAVGIVPALAGAWGFNGVFWFALVRTHPDSPGTVTGAVAPGGFVGGTVGPVVFGMLAAGPGYPVAWSMTAACALAASAAMFALTTRLEQRGAGTPA